MEINAANVSRHTFFAGSQVWSAKNGWIKIRFGELSTKEIQTITDNIVSVRTTSHNVRDEIIQLYVSVTFLLKVAKFQILHIYQQQFLP